jgi:hypothetical protein
MDAGFECRIESSNTICSENEKSLKVFEQAKEY